MMQHRQERQAPCTNGSSSSSSSSNSNHGIQARQSSPASSSQVLACRSQPSSRRATWTKRPAAIELCSSDVEQLECRSSPAASIAWSPTYTSSSNSRSLLSVLAWSMTLLLVSSCLGIADAGALMGHPFSKRSFMDIQCKGVYDKALFARLDRICEDCYNLFREPQLHTLCRKNCFTSDYFKGCLDVLLLQDEMEWIQTSIKQLHGADPGV